MSYSTCLHIAVLYILGTLASSLQASDSVVLIDQASVAAGTVTPGAAGFPITLSQPGSYRLESNLVVPNANVSAIKITADNVTLDLNGYSIIGPGLCKDNGTTLPTCLPAGTGIGVLAGSDTTLGPRSVRVLNGSVRGMGSHGIQLTGKDSFVKDVAADLNAGSGFVVNGSVVESSAMGNGADGIRSQVVRDSTTMQNHLHGIVLSFGGVAIGNAVSQNGFRGIFVRNGSAISNTVTLNSNIGILAECPSSIVNNTVITDASFVSIVADGSGCAVANNGTSQ
jgi:hypothetical protein